MSLHDAIKQAEQLICDCAHEIAYAFDDEGNVILVKDGNERQVAFTYRECRMLSGKYLTHNHPNGSSFSSQDVTFAYTHKVREFRATSPEYTYILWFPKGLELDEMSFNTYYMVECNKMVSFAPDHLRLPDGSLERWYFAQEHHKVLLRCAERFGFNYKRVDSEF